MTLMVWLGLKTSTQTNCIYPKYLDSLNFYSHPYIEQDSFTSLMCLNPSPAELEYTLPLQTV